MTAKQMGRKRWEGTTEAQRKAFAKRIGKLGGRPLVLKTCATCGHVAGTAAMRGHRCPAK